MERLTARFAGRIYLIPHLIRLYEFTYNRRTALAVMLKITYGYTPREGADWESLTASFGKALETLNALIPGSWLVDALPFLRHLPSWVPGGGFKKIAAEMRTSLLDMVDVPYNVTKQEMV